tara:strand:+ start:3160 stop:4083 length:924 start_codon:yes stop_codon:yes gene_type:complete
MFGEIVQIEFSFPKKKQSIKNLCKKYRWNYNAVISKTGIKNRFVSNKSENALLLAIKACKKIKNIERIDALVYVTQSPEYPLPTTACIIQDKLKLSKKVLAFDINQGCSGFLYGLFTGLTMINSSQINNVLLVCSDTYTKYISNNNKSCSTIFSDAASATLISANKRRITEAFNFETDGSGYKDLIVEESKNPKLFMDGRKVLMFTMGNVPGLVKKTLKDNKCKMKDIKMFIFHQASKVVLDNLQRILNIDNEKIYKNFQSIGNTVSSTIPIALKECLEKKRIKKGDKILICGFGVGYSMAASVVKI